MKLKIRGTGDGAALDIIEPGQGSGVEDTLVTSIDVVAGKELDINLPTATVIEQIEYAEAVPSEVAGGSDAPTTDPESSGPNAGEQGGGDQASGESSGTPADGETSPSEPQNSEPAKTSAASEKPLYLVGGETIPDGFSESGLETPDGKTLFHFGNDVAGGPTTGNLDGVSVYAESADNEKPVQPATPAESEAPAP